MKSASASQARRTHKLNNLLRGKTRYEPSVDDHLPYFWAAYKKGCFDIMSDNFKQILDQKQFTEQLETFLSDNNLTPISFFAEVDGKERIIGIGTFWVRGRVMQTENLIWFPWSKKRLVLEAYINFVNEIRKLKYNDTDKNLMVLEFAQEKDARYFDHVCRYGIMRRVGTSEEVYPGGKCCIYESRSIRNAE